MQADASKATLPEEKQHVGTFGVVTLLCAIRLVMFEATFNPFHDPSANIARPPAPLQTLVCACGRAPMTSWRCRIRPGTLVLGIT